MIVINATCVNNALLRGLKLFYNRDGNPSDVVEVTHSRNGEVWRIDSPVTTVYENPSHRVLTSATRNANPFFHLFEALWTLAGRKDLKFLETYVSRIREFSDDGVTLNGAYGWRWRNHFSIDQLTAVIDLLTTVPNTRRAVLAMWDGGHDMYHARSSKDVPCNTTIYFSRRGQSLDMTVCCRSNDALWGAYGANAVHMSFLQSFVAGALGICVGRYFQVSNDLHLYTSVMSKMDVPKMICELDAASVATNGRLSKDDYLGVAPDNWREFLLDCETLVHSPPEQLVKNGGFKSLYFKAVVQIMLIMYHSRGCLRSEILAWGAANHASPWVRDGARWIAQNRRAK